MFPELKNSQKSVEILDEEERLFAKTLDRGEKLFGQLLSSYTNEDKKISGKDAWKLYDTYGFPLDLTMLMALEHGLLVDQDEFEECQKKAKERSKLGNKMADDSEYENVKFDVHDLDRLDRIESVKSTDDSYKYGTLNSFFPLV